MDMEPGILKFFTIFWLFAVWLFLGVWMGHEMHKDGVQAKWMLAVTLLIAGAMAWVGGCTDAASRG
jgi:hypothetical protein